MTSPSEEGPACRPEPSRIVGTGHHTEAATPPSAPPASAPPMTTSRPPPTDSDRPPPEVWCTVLERGHYYVVAATATSPGPQWVIKGTDTMLAPAAVPPEAIGDPTKVLRGVLQPGDKAPARALARITSGRAGYHLGLAMLCLSQRIKRCWPSTGTCAGSGPSPPPKHKSRRAPTRGRPPPPGHNTPSSAGTTPSTGSSAAWTLAHPYSTVFPPPTKRCTK